MRMFVCRAFLLTILITLAPRIGISQESVINATLSNKMSVSSDSELIQVIIFFKGKKVFSPAELTEMSSKTAQERQYHHAMALKQFGDVQSANVKALIKAGDSVGTCQLLVDLWAAYGVACLATKDIIEKFGKLSEVREIVWDWERSRVELSVGEFPSGPRRVYDSKNQLGKDLSTASVEWGVSKVKAPDVWNLGYQGQGVVVAILDDGCNYNHPDLVNHLWDGSSFTYHGQPIIHHGWNLVENNNNPMTGGAHGTPVAGIIVGDGTGGTQTGVAPQAKIMIIRNDPGPPTVNEAMMKAGIQWLFDVKIENPTLRYPDVINMSQGLKFDDKPTYESWRDLCKNVFDAGMLIVAGAGNEAAGSPGSCAYTDHNLPACSPCIVEVCPPWGIPCGHPVPYTVRVPANVPSPWIHPSQPAPLSTAAPDNHISSVLAVGWTDNSDVIHGSSSRGPSAWENMYALSRYWCQFSIRQDYWDYLYTPPGNNALIKPDVSAPGGVLSTAVAGGYISFDGTSSAAPHASGTVALMISANMSLRSAPGTIMSPRIAQVLQLSALELGSAGKDNEYGAGRVNAYEAVVWALADANKSVSVNATSSNSQRKLVRDSSGKLHLAFESGNEIFYTNSTSSGTSWQPVIRLSDGTNLASYPAITERSGYLYAVWQKANGNSWHIVYSYSTNGGATWLTTPITLVSSLTTPNPGPIPVILAGTPANSFEVMIAYRTNSDLKSARSTTNPPTLPSWSTVTVVGSNSASKNPSLAYKTSFPYYSITWDNGSATSYNDFYGPTWNGSATDITSWLIGHDIYNTINSSYAVSQNNDKHIVTQGTDQGWGAVIHIKNLTQSVYTEFLYQYYRNFLKPVVTGNSAGKAYVAWYRDDNVIYKVNYPGTTFGTPVSFGVNDKLPILSINNPPGGTAYAMWAEGATAPYSILTNANGGPLQKGNLDWTYSRRISLATADRSSSVRIELTTPSLILSDGSQTSLPFRPVADGSAFDVGNVWTAFETESSTFSATTQGILRLDYLLAGMRNSRLSSISFALGVVDTDAANVLSEQILTVPTTDSSSFVQNQLNMTVQIPAGKTIKFNVRSITPLDKAFNVAVGNIYRQFGTPAIIQDSVLNRFSVQSPDNAFLDIYPNPFNPTATLKYEIKVSGRVTLSIFNVLGQEVSKLVDDSRQQGTYTAAWNAMNEPSGVYYARLTVIEGSGRETNQVVKKLLLAK